LLRSRRRGQDSGQQIGEGARRQSPGALGIGGSLDRVAKRGLIDGWSAEQRARRPRRWESGDLAGEGTECRDIASRVGTLAGFGQTAQDGAAITGEENVGGVEAAVRDGSLVKIRDRCRGVGENGEQ
jgi:hypothetical protein